MTTLIDGGTVIGYRDGQHQVIRNGQVAFDGNAITFVGREYDGEVTDRIDARGNIVIPGLINHHMAFGVHMQLFRLDRARPNFFNSGMGLGVQPSDADPANTPDAEDWQASARYAMATALRTGSTTFVMIPNTGRQPFRGRFGTDQDLVNTVTEFGMRAYLTLPYSSMDIIGTEAGTLEWIDQTEAGWRGLEMAVEFAREFDGYDDGRVRTFLHPSQSYSCSTELLQASKQAAAELGCTLKIHVAQYLPEFNETLLRTGQTPIQYLDDIGFLGPEVSLTHAIFTPRHPWLGYPELDETDTRIIADSGATVAHCPVVFARSGVILHSFSHYVRFGIAVSLGTDTLPHDMFMELRNSAIFSKLADNDPASGLAREVFDAATLGGAAALQRDDIGRLSPGAKADIVLVDADRLHIGPVAADDPVKALVYCARGDDVNAVIVDGVTKVRNGELLGWDVAELRTGADRFNSKLRASVGRSTYQGRPLTEYYGSSFPDRVE